MLLDQLKAKQIELKETDEEFAIRLAVSRQMWNFTKNGNQPIGWSVLLGALKNFPELAEDAINFLLENASKLANNTNTLAANQSKEAN